MKLIRLYIDSYKSIEHPVRIDVKEPRVLAFIGKNGSGKSNLLKAVRHALAYPMPCDIANKNSVAARYVFDLDEGDRAQIAKALSVDRIGGTLELAVRDGKTTMTADARDGDVWRTFKNDSKECDFFRRAVRDSGKCYFIDNESALLFGGVRTFSQERVERDFNSISPVAAAIDGFLRDKKLIATDETVRDISDEDRLGEIAAAVNGEFLSRIVPDFDIDEISGYFLKLCGGRLELFVTEAGGKQVPVSETSLGRRWYLTFVIVRQLLRTGDRLFIDEPGAFLHPHAQAELRDELSALARRGVSVFISTHSPYMIPSDWRNIISLSNGKNGTQAKMFDSENELSQEIRKELGELRTTDILFNIAKTIVLVEGVTDEACINKFSKLLGYDMRRHKIHVCDGESIIQLSYLCIKNQIKFKAIADNDNKYKNDEYVRTHSNYEECIKAMTESDDCIFIGNGSGGELENMFAAEDRKFFHKGKVSRERINAVKSTREVSKKTLDNFRKLFERMGLKKI